ncbi:MAG: hypothetical protein Q8M16_19860 [Pirellulaceae bacterium]|nr:hypothetical protein [Pirellulaceae bacterium]
MFRSNRRVFMSDVGRSMFAAGLGATLAENIGFSAAFAEQSSDSISLGKYEALVELIRNTPAAKLQSIVAKMIISGETTLTQLTAASALANAVTFGGCDYVGYHTAMAMLPALELSRSLPNGRQPLPVLKVLYRNALQIQEVGTASQAALEAYADAEHSAEHATEGSLEIQIRDACRRADTRRAERLLSTVVREPLDAFNALQPAAQDDLNVHRYVFAHRVYGLVGLLGQEHANTILSQFVRFCADNERQRIERKQPASPIRAILPKLLDQYKLVGKELGRRDPGDSVVETLAETIYQSSREVAAEATAAALAEGIDPEVVGEAISLASNLYVLRQGSDKWRTHGDSAGVHSSDATNAWRNMARTTDARHAIAGLVVAAYHAGIQEPPFQTPPYPTDEHRAQITADDCTKLLAETEDAIRSNDQGRATAAIAIYGERVGQDARAAEPVLALMRKYAVSEDGRLHGEKYYHTVVEEFHSTRPAFRWRHIVGLARVTASAYGYNRTDQHGFRAAGYEEACELLGVEV